MGDGGISGVYRGGRCVRYNVVISYYIFIFEGSCLIMMLAGLGALGTGGVAK